MAGRFPHLDSDAYPHLDNVHPYRRKVPFDYERYDYTAEIKLCNVPWPIDYKHVINWPDASARDAWFAALEGRTVELPNGFTRTQTDSVRIDVPYDVALTYNYVFMRVPQLTEDDPIRHESEPAVRIVCAWIQEAIYFAPSTTELVLEVDYWTTYLPHLAPTTLMLHRGHAPAYAMDAETYLANPKENCWALLTPDINFGISDVVAHADLIDIAQGKKLLVLASTIPYASVERLTMAQSQDTGETTPPTYYDTGFRDGRQVGVSGYEWHYGGFEYADMRNPSGYTGQGGAMPVFTSLYAIDANQAQTALRLLAERLPQFIQSVQGAYILPRRALTFTERTYNVGGVRMYGIAPQAHMQGLADIHLTKALFGYPTRYADIAKLYTSPYAHLVISDTLGNELDVRIEDLDDNPRIIEQISPMHECLRWDVLLEGANDAGSTSYRWITLNDATIDLSLPGTDVSRYTLQLGIPTYALYLDGRIAYNMRTYYDGQIQRDNAVTAYQTGMKSTNTGAANASDSATTGQVNAVAGADTAETNAYASADTNVANVANNGATATSNAAIANNLRTTSTGRNNQAGHSLMELAQQNIYDSLNADLEYDESAYDANMKSEALSSAVTTVGALATGNIMGAISSGVSGVLNITTNSALLDAAMYQITDKEAIGQDYQANTQAQQASNATDQTSYTNTANTNTTANNVNNANTNANNSAATAKANATRTANTSRTSAIRTGNTSRANAGYSRDTSESNAKQTLELARRNYERQGHAHDLDSPTSYGTVAGDHSADALMRRVLQVRIETQSKSAIARAGDGMLRFGYMYDGLWDVAQWCPDAHDGCYWEATDVIVSADNITNASAERVYETILKEGVTVWNDPAKIGGLPW